MPDNLDHRRGGHAENRSEPDGEPGPPTAAVAGHSSSNPDQRPPCDLWAV